MAGGKMGLRMVSWLLGAVLLVGVVKGLTAADLETYSSDGLLALETQLKGNVVILEGNLSKAKAEVEQINGSMLQLESQLASMQEARETGLKEKENLQSVRDKLVEKTQEVESIRKSVDEIKTRMETMRVQVANLQAEKTKYEQQYSNPSLSDVLDKRAQDWSFTSRTLYQKIKNNVFQSVWTLSSDVRSYQNSIRQKSRFLGPIVAMIMYGFTIGFVGMIIYIYRKLRGQLTIAKLIFLGDSFCCCFWLITLLCYMVLWTDPLYVVKLRSQTLFFCFQLLGGLAYVFYVILRVFVLAEQLSLAPFGELSSVIIVGHHFYVRVWQPALTDIPFRGSFFHYLIYAWLFSSFTYKGIQEFSPLQQLRGPKLGFLTWLRVVYKRFTLSRVPSGELPSRTNRYSRSSFFSSDDDSSSFDSDSDRDD